MAATVNTVVHITNSQLHEITITNEGTGTNDESDVVKVDMSAIATAVGKVGYTLAAVDIERIRGQVAGYTPVRLEYDADANDEIAVLGLGGEIDFDWRDVGGNKNPLSAGATGDIVLSTLGGAAGDSYTLRLDCRLRYR